jgi:hypothetical protein
MNLTSVLKVLDETADIPTVAKAIVASMNDLEKETLLVFFSGLCSDEESLLRAIDEHPSVALAICEILLLCGKKEERDDISR